MARPEFTERIYEATPQKKLSMADLLDIGVDLGASDIHIAVDLGASDIHIAAERPPRYRIGRDLLPYELAANRKDGEKHGSFSPITLDATIRLLNSLFTGQAEPLGLQQIPREIDLSVSTEKARFRVNIGMEDRGPYATFRVIPSKIIEASDLGFPNEPYEIWKKIIEEKQGLVLITGVTNSGKSTTLASILQEIGRRRYAKIITVEDPIEYALKDNRAMFFQRELGRNTSSFADAVKYALRQNPDILMIGEMRDRETMQQGIVAAQTGNLVFSTLHTKSADKSVERVIELFPEGMKKDIAHSLADALKYVISQELVPYDKETKGRTLAVEIMVVNESVRNLIRDGKPEQLRTYIQNNSREGAITMEAHLGKLYEIGKVSREMALYYARDKKDMQRILSEKTPK